MDDVIGDTQATFGMIGTIRAMLDDLSGNSIAEAQGDL